MTTSVPATDSAASLGAPRLKRVLSLWDLIFYGIVAITPCAPAMIYGVAEVRSHGFVVVTILAAMVATVLTAISYGRMAARYPSAGSAYAYVSQGMHPYLGFVAGWAMLLDYLLIPLFSVIFGTLSLQRIFPALSFPLGAFCFALGITLLNLGGIRSTARANHILLFLMFAVLFSFIALAIRYLVVRHGFFALFSTEPFYNRATFHLRDIATATSFAALTFIGFDSVTTMAEDVKDPRRNVLLAAVSICVFTGLFGGLLVYLGHMVWPNYTTFTNVDTAFIDVTGRVGGVALLKATAVLVVLANVGGGLTCQVGAARLLFGMGRENVIPARYFARLHPRRNTPDVNIILIGVFSFLGSQIMSYEFTAELLNFGAFLGFMGVNAAVIWRFWVRPSESRRRNFLLDVLLPFLGFLFCTAIWVGLGRSSQIAGGVWLLAGFLVLVTHTRWFRRPFVLPDPATYE